MKCKYTFPVTGHIKFPFGMEFSANDRYYEFKVKDGLVSDLSVTIANISDSSLPDVVSHNEGKIKASISIPPNPPFWDDLISDIRTVEGALCLWDLEGINTDYFTTEWIPESEEEKERLKLFSFSIAREDEPTENLPQAPIDMFVRSVLAVSDLKESETPLNFYRRGRMDISKERYIDAIYDLYFVLETLFANGKFKKNQVIEEFASSSILLDGINHIKSDIDPQIRNEPILYTDFVSKYLNRNEKEIIEHVLELRGFLHHHNLNRKTIWHPANQREFKVDALTLLRLCHHVLSKKIFEILFQKHRIDEFLKTEVKAKDGQTIQWNGQK